MTHVGKTSRGNESPENPALMYDVPLSKMKILSADGANDDIFYSFMVRREILLSIK